jgi:hypothetical protein
MKKFAFVNIPSQELERPPAAAAAISACVKSAGWDCKVFDFNLFLNANVPSSVWVELEEYWRCKKLDLDSKTKQLLNDVIDKFLVEIKQYSPDMVGLSVFTRFSVVPAAILLEHIRKQIDAKIVIGGSGSFAWPGSLPSLNTENLESSTFAEYAKQIGLIDYFIQGEGETAIVALLQGNDTAPGINGVAPEQVKNLNLVPHPDYTGIEPSKYFYTHEPGIYITATRGCIRKCTFCNIPEMWPKFEARSADDVVREIINGKKNYDVNVFHFTDSLLNGNMKIWREINRQLIKAKDEDADLAPVKYLGQFICRTRLDQTERDWDLMSRAGADLLVVGFEHFSPHVRKHMGKNYSNADIDFHFAQSGRLGIKNVALMFVGYPVETQEDHEYNIEFLHRYRRYAKAGIIHMIRWGYTGMFRDAKKVEKPGEVKLITDPDFAKKFNNLPQGIRDIALGFGWINELNPTLTLRERIRRRLELHEISVKLGWPQTRNREELQILYNILENLNANIVNATDFDNLETLLDFH